MKLLIVDDDQEIVAAITRGLRHRYLFDSAENSREALELVHSTEYDAILIDVGLPGVSGFDLCRKLRHSGVTSPILMLSGQFGGADHKVQGLDAGADDYVLKPVNLDELSARIRALLRRGKPTQLSGDTLNVGELTLFVPDRIVKRRDTRIRLNRKEFDLLEYLARHPNRVLTREMIFNNVWDSDANGLNNTVDVHIKYLRDKVDRPFNTYMIQTVYGLGYKLVT